MARTVANSPDGRWLVVVSSLSMAVSPISAALLAPILARLLGDEGRGQLSAILAPLTLADAIATVGLPAAITFYRARGTSSKALLRLAGPLAVVSSLVTYGILAAYANVVGAQQGIDPNALRAIWLFVLVGLALGIFRGIRMGEQAWLSINLERIAGPVLRLLACTGLILTGDIGVQAVAAVYLVSGLLGSFCLLVGSRRRATSSQEEPRRIELYSFGVRSWFTSLSYTVNSRVDQVVLAGLIAPAQLGHYAVAVTIAELPSVVYKAANRILFSRVAAGSSWEVAAQMNRAIFWSSLVGAAGIAAVSPFVIPVLFGSDFTDSVLLTQILLIASVLASSSSILGAAVSGAGRPGSVSLTELSGVIATAIGLALAVPWLGATGAAITVVITQLVILSSRIAIFCRQSSLSLRHVFVPTRTDLRMLFSRGGKSR